MGAGTDTGVCTGTTGVAALLFSAVKAMVGGHVSCGVAVKDVVSTRRKWRSRLPHLIPT